MLNMRQLWDRNPRDYDTIMLRAACCLCFFGLLKVVVSVSSGSGYDKGEHLDFSDIAINNLSNPKMLKVKFEVYITFLHFFKASPF